MLSSGKESQLIDACIQLYNKGQGKRANQNIIDKTFGKSEKDFYNYALNQIKAGPQSNYLIGKTEDHYFKTFQTLVNYISQSLDDYKAELKNTLFPIYIYSYLDMFVRGFKSCKKFLSTYLC